jgi:putative acetyltransferase
MTVRPYRPEDFAAVLRLFQRSVRELASRDYTPEQISAWAPDSPDVAQWSKRLSNQSVFVCEDQNQIAGFASVDRDGHLDLLYVHPDVQRQGVASVLCAHIIQWATAHNLDRLFTEASVTARPFFESRGFNVVSSQIVQAHGVDLANFRMVLAL